MIWGIENIFSIDSTIYVLSIEYRVETNFIISFKLQRV